MNLGNGRFADVSHVGGVDFPDDARGIAAVDWDQDGDLDFWLNNRSSPKARLMRNDHAAAGRGWRLRLVGTRSNRDAVGARVALRLADGKSLLRTVRAGVNYTVQGSKWLHFGLGDTAAPSDLEVRWPSGAVTRHQVPPSGETFALVEGEEALREVHLASAPTRLAAEAFEVEPLPRTASIPLGRPLEVPADLAMTDFAGRTHRVSDYAGKPLLINLWASWCAPCRGEFEDFEDHRRGLEKSGVSILACSVDEEPQMAAAAARALGVHFPTGMCDERLLGLVETVKKVVFDRYEDLSLPTSLLLDGEGRLARIYVGPADAAALSVDARALAAAPGDLDTLRLAAMTSGGHWERPEVWLASQRGSQLVHMTRFLSQENRGGLLSYYANALADALEGEPTPERALARATDTLLEAGQTLAAEAPLEAVAIFRRLLRFRAGDPQVYWNLAWSLLEGEGDSAEAHAMADAALKLAATPASPREAAFRGLVLQRLGRPQLAAAELEVALAADPSDATLAATLAAARAEAERSDQAVKDLRARMLAAAEDPAPALALAKLLDQRGQAAEAREVFERYVTRARAPGGAFDAGDLGRVYFRLERWREAAETLAPVVAAGGERTPERRLLGMALAHAGEDAGARRHLQALPAGDATSDYLLGIVQARMGDLALAAETFERVIELRPDHVEAARSLALAYDHLGQPERAVQAFRRYLEAAPRDIEARRRYAKDLELTGSMDEAMTAYRAILAIEPQDVATRYRLAWLLATNGAPEHRDGATALAMAKELNAENPRHAALLDLLAAAYAENGEFERAQSLAAEATELARGSGDRDLAAQIDSRLDLYARGHPFHGAS